MKLSLLLCFCAFICISQAYVYKSAQFNASLKAWKALKPRCYTYTVVNVNDASPATVSRTTIKVQNNKVVSRSYEQTELFHFPTKVLASWKETTTKTIGSHGGEYGTDISPAVTLDKIYSYCHDNILTQDQDIWNGEDSNSAAFEVSQNKVIAYCAFYLGQCGGFCGDIINIDSFSTC